MLAFSVDLQYAEDPSVNGPRNITPTERAGRLLIGLLGVVGGLVLLTSGGGTGVAVLEVLLVLAGLDLMITGALRHCPLYRKLGYSQRGR